MEIEWDAGKARSNLARHGVSFADAESVLFDPYALTVADDRVVAEDRHVHVTIGLDALGRTLVVVYAVYEEAIRIISARPATPGESKTYETGI